MIAGYLLGAAGVAGLVSLCVSRRSPLGWLSLTLVGAVSASGAAAVVLGRGMAWEWRGGWAFGGEPLHLRMDGLSAWFLILVAGVGAAGAVYSREYWADDGHPVSAWRGRAWWIALLGFFAWVLLAANGLQFLFAWEGFTVCAYFLIMLDGRRREVRAAGWLYLAASHAGTLALFAFFALLAARTGSWELGPLRGRTDLAPLFWLALFGFGVKAGWFPLHVWLPSAHANAPSHVSAILSGVAIKMGVYGIARFGGWLPVPEAAAWLVAVGGVVSAVLGVVFALGQHDLKRLLAYHSVENIGIILAGVGFALVAAGRGDGRWGALALAGGLLHVWNHGLFKALLFLGAGSVGHATGTRELSRLGGLWRVMPWTAGLFALGSVAIAGLPPLNGFVSEWLLYLGLFDAVRASGALPPVAIAGVVGLAMTGALALACFVKVCAVVFLGAPRSDGATRGHDGGPWVKGPMLFLAAGCVFLGLAPVLIWPFLQAAVGAWNDAWIGVPAPDSLGALGRVHVLLAILAVAASTGLLARVRRGRVVRAPTWDCGYARPSSRMQYSAGSFAATVTGWFAWVLRPERKVELPTAHFPERAVREEHTPEVVLERWIAPLAGEVMRLSGWVRRWQHGRVQAYLLYLLLGTGVLAVLTAAWSP